MKDSIKEIPSRTIFKWSWDSAESQSSFIKTVGFDNPEKSFSQVMQIKTLLNLSPCKMIDIGCGNGRQTQIFAQEGYDVFGIDISKMYLKEARKNAEKEHISVQYGLLRASELQQIEEYNFALAYHHSIGFLSEEELPLHFHKIYMCLKPKGVFLFEMAGPKLDGKFTPFRNWEEKEDAFVLVDKKMQNGYREELCIFIDKATGNIKEFHEKQRAFSLAQLKKLLRSAGFKNIQAYADLKKTPATKSAFGVFVCYK